MRAVSRGAVLGSMRCESAQLGGKIPRYDDSNFESCGTCKTASSVVEVQVFTVAVRCVMLPSSSALHWYTEYLKATAHL
eukprot:IDg13430t1